MAVMAPITRISTLALISVITLIYATITRISTVPRRRTDPTGSPA
jgi:hypothetical protein